MHTFSPEGLVLLILGSLAAGFINVFAGGGGIIVLLVMMLAGLSPVSANMTQTIAVMPGLITSFWVNRADLDRHRHRLPMLARIGLLGGLAGALLLLLTPGAWFGKVVPYLVLFATATFVYGTWFFKKTAGGGPLPGAPGWGQILGLILLSIYGGYYGGGVSIMILALMSLGSWGGIHEMNALKLFFGVMTNVAGVLLFSRYGAISWTAVIIVAIGTSVGGYIGAKSIKRVNTGMINALVVAFSLTMTVYLFMTQR